MISAFNFTFSEFSLSNWLCLFLISNSYHRAVDALVVFEAGTGLVAQRSAGAGAFGIGLHLNGGIASGLAAEAALHVAGAKEGGTGCKSNECEEILGFQVMGFHDIY